jgi:DNA invertase Pin-like site-specific DNA recombinase
MKRPTHHLNSKTAPKPSSKPSAAQSRTKTLTAVLKPWRPATKKLIADLGRKCEIYTHDGALVLVWEINSHGDGIVVARLSDPDQQGGEQVLAQVHDQMAYVAARGKTVRYVIVTTDNSGGRSLEARPDMARVVREIRRGACRWISYAKSDRLTRVLLEGEAFTTFLRETDTTLIVCDLGEIDWRTSDKLLLQMMMVVAEAERDSIEARMTAGQYRGLDAGKPMGGPLPFGVRRAKDGFAEVDPARRPVVRAILNEFSSFQGANGSGTREFAKSLCRRGGRAWQVNANQVTAVLQSPIWLRGSWIQTRGDKEFTIRVRGAESLLVPIDRWQFNQQLLEMRAGREKTSDVGTRPLKHVVLRHADCGGLLELDRSRVGETNKRLHHRSGTARCRCTFPEAAVERAVVEYLKRLATEPDEVATANSRAWPEWASLLGSGRSSFDAITADVAHEMRKEETALRAWLDKSGIDPWGPYQREFERVRDICPTALHVLAQLDRAESVHDVPLRIPFWRSKVWFEADIPALKQVFVDALVPATPSTSAQRLLRAQLIKRCVSEVEIYGSPKEFTLKIRGTRIPREWALEPLSPVHFAALELEYAAKSRMTGRKNKTRTDAAEYAATAPSLYRLGAVAASEMWEAMGYEVGPSWVSERLRPDYNDPTALRRARQLRTAAKGRTTRPARRTTTTRSAGPLFNLIANAFLVPGERLTLTHHGKQHVATLLADGWIRVKGGQEHETPSAASQAVKGLKSDPGMHSWHVLRGGDLVSLKDIAYYSDVLEHSRAASRSQRKKV